MMHLAALTLEEVKTVMAVVQFVATIAMAILLQYVNSKAGRIKDLEADLKQATAKAIDDKITVLRTEQAGVVQLFNQQIQQMDSRLRAGDAHFKASDERTHKLEVDILKALQGLKEHMATKDDLNRLREELRR